MKTNESDSPYKPARRTASRFMALFFALVAVVIAIALAQKCPGQHPFPILVSAPAKLFYRQSWSVCFAVAAMNQLPYSGPCIRHWSSGSTGNTSAR